MYMQRISAIWIPRARRWIRWKKIKLADSVQAPAKKGHKVGTAEYYLEGEKIGAVDLVLAEGTDKAGYTDCLRKVWEIFSKKTA